jgi:arylsulfatase A-like enzyme
MYAWAVVAVDSRSSLPPAIGEFRMHVDPRHGRCRLLVACAVLVSTVSAATNARAGERPNIVFILADDLGWTDLGCYGSAFYETPAIDELATRGLRFTQAYTACPVCSPTRSSIMTGKYPVRTGITDYIPGQHPAGVRLETPYTRTELALDEFTVAEALRDAGYLTFYSGKWHLGEAGYGPREQGFDVVVENDSLGDFRLDPLVGDRLTRSALQFLDKRDPTRPFFMFLSYHEPHRPIVDHPDTIEHFRAKTEQAGGDDPAAIAERRGFSRTVQNMAGYACEVAVLDSAVRQVVARLDEQGLLDSTVIIFTSDNGGLCTVDKPGPTSNLPLRSGKGWLYEGGVRVPLIVVAPGLTQAGTTCDAPLMSTDYYPTLLELAGAAPRPEQHLDGDSIRPLLAGESRSARPLYWHYPHYHGTTWAPGGAVRDGDWKLIEFWDEDSVELYNLETDIGERSNLASSQPERVAALRAQLAQWRDATGAVMPAGSRQGVTAGCECGVVCITHPKGSWKAVGRNRGRSIDARRRYSNVWRVTI